MDLEEIIAENDLKVMQWTKSNWVLRQESAEEIPLIVMVRYLFSTRNRNRLFRHKSWPNNRFVYFKSWYIAVADLSKNRKPKTQLEKELLTHNALDIEMQPKHGWLRHNLTPWQRVKFEIYKVRHERA